MEYLVLEENTADKIAKTVGDFLDNGDGWKPYGNLVVLCTPPNEDGTYYTRYIQAIVKD